MTALCGTTKVNGEKIVQIQVEVSFEFYSEDESFNVLTSVVGFGTSNTEVEADFADFGQANEVAYENVTPILQV